MIQSRHSIVIHRPTHEFEADQKLTFKVQRDVARKLPPHEHRRKGSRLRP